jgi:hypothetical protein
MEGKGSKTGAQWLPFTGVIFLFIIFTPEGKKRICFKEKSNLFE